MPKNNHGGKRKGSGRKKGPPTIVKRIPKSIESEVEQLITRTKAKDK